MNGRLNLGDFVNMGNAIVEFMTTAKNKEGALLAIVGYAIDSLPKKQQINTLKETIKSMEAYIALNEDTA